MSSTGDVPLQDDNANPDDTTIAASDTNSVSNAVSTDDNNNETNSNASSVHSNDDDADIIYDFEPIKKHQPDNDLDNHTILSAASQPSSNNNNVINEIPPEPPPTPKAPIDNLQATILDVLDPNPPPNATQRDPKAKDDINPEITEENIVVNEVDNRPSTQRYAMRSQVEPKVQYHFSSKYGFTFAQFIHNMKSNIVEPKAPSIFSSRFGLAFTQISAREGLRRFGERAANALITEWLQLDQLDEFEGVKFASITPENRKKALHLVQLIKEKRCGKIKGRNCADERKQSSYISEEDATSPTVHGEAVLISCMIDGH